MTPTLTLARAELHALIDGAHDDLEVLDVEPIQETPGPTFATIALTGLSTTQQEWQVRIYVSFRDAGSESAYALDEILTAVDERMVAADQFTAPDWEIGIDEALLSWVARARVTRGREDF